MKADLINDLLEKFESACYKYNGVECWSARELQTILGYAQWRNFVNAIDYTGFNQGVKHVSNLMRVAAMGGIMSMSLRDKGTLLSSVKNYTRVQQGVANRLSLSFSRHGVFQEKGAGRGHGGSKGSVWYDSQGRRKTTNPQSFGKMGSGKRIKKPWFNPVIDNVLPLLEAQVAQLKLNYGKAFPNLNAMINAQHIKIK